MLIRHIHLPTVISKFLPTLALTTVILIAPPSKSLGNYRELAVASLECDLDSVCSTFDENTEGWASVLGATGPQYIAAGGNPGGHICATDAASGGTRWFWKVPLAYLGDMSSAYNLTLRFDLKVSNFNVDFSEDVLLVGSGLTIAFDLPGDPVRDTWTSFDIELNETAGWTIQGSNEVPTQAQMQSVLGSLTDVLLRGDFAGGTTCLDNVTLDAPPSVFSPRTTFDSDTEDWAAVQGASFSHVSEGLIPPRGHVCATDAASGGTRWFWKASGEYLGDVSAGYDSALTFQIKQSVQGLIQAVNDVKLVGAGLTLTFDTYVNPGIDWTSYWVPLNESAGWKTEGGSLATQAELQAVLASLTDVFIRGDYGGGIGCLDDVDLEPPKTTTTLEPSYYFDADTEGWDVITNNSGVEWLPTGGNPRGHVCVTDSLSGGARWFWKIPLDGDVSSYYGKDLTFDLKQSVFGLTAFLDDVKLVSGPFTLIFDTSVNPGVDWTSYRVPLREGAGWKFEGAPSDLPPTKEEIQAVMSELSDLLIRGDYAGGQGCLDNVEFREESANDGDSDGVFDSEDNCPQVSNSLQADADGDGIGDACECGDATGDGFVNTLDARLIQRFSTGQIPKPVLCDVTGEGGCNTIDARLIQRFAVGELNKADLQCAERP